MASSSSALEEMMVQWEEQKVMWMKMRMRMGKRILAMDYGNKEDTGGAMDTQRWDT